MSSKTPVRIIFGTHTIGDRALTPGIACFDDEKEINALLETFRSRGYTEIDTASDYLKSEAQLGKVGAASRFIIHTKVHSSEPGAHEPSNIQLSVQKSLEDLQTSSVRTMFLHVPDRHTPFEDTAKAMNDAFKQGKFEQFGLSNYSASEVKRFIEICEQNGYVKPSVFEGHYNAIVRGGEKELFPLLRQHNIAFFAYSPSAGGLFSDHTATSARWGDGNPVAKLYSSLYGKPPVKAAVSTVQDAAEKYGISGHAAALRWTAFHSALDGKYGDAVVFTVSKVQQLPGSLDALEAGPLPQELADAITAVYTTVEGSEPCYHL